MILELLATATRPLFRPFRRTTIEVPVWERAVFYAALAVVLFVSLFPFYWMFTTSIVPEIWLYNLPPKLFPTEFTLENYETLFGAESVPFVQFFLNSLFIGTVSAALGLAFSIFGAYSFARLEYPGRSIFSRASWGVERLSSMSSSSPHGSGKISSAISWTSSSVSRIRT